MKEVRVARLAFHTRSSLTVNDKSRKYQSNENAFNISSGSWSGLEGAYGRATNIRLFALLYCPTPPHRLTNHSSVFMFVLWFFLLYPSLHDCYSPLFSRSLSLSLSSSTYLCICSFYSIASLAFGRPTIWHPDSHLWSNVPTYRIKIDCWMNGMDNHHTVIRATNHLLLLRWVCVSVFVCCERSETSRWGWPRFHVSSRFIWLHTI